jgi:hypothetical protein
MKHAVLSFILAIFALIVVAATATQVNDYENGNVLTAGELNSEFGNIYTTLNNLDFDNFAPGTLLPPTIIDSIIAGLGLTQNPTTGALDVNVDGTSLDITLDVVSVKDDGITAAKIAANAVGTSEIANDAVTSAKIPNNAIGTTEIADLAVTSAKFADGSITNAKLANNAVNSAKIQDNTVTKNDLVDVTVTSNSGSPSNVVYGTPQSGTLTVNGLGSGSVTTSLTLTTQGSAVMTMIAPKFGSGDGQMDCVDRQNLVRVFLKVNGGVVATWKIDNGLSIGPPGPSLQINQNGSFYQPYMYVDGRGAGTHTYEYVFQIDFAPGGEAMCDYNNWTIMAYEL